MSLMYFIKLPIFSFFNVFDFWKNPVYIIIYFQHMFYDKYGINDNNTL